MKKSITYREALAEGLRYAFKNDPRVFMMGEDIGKYGGPYGVTKGFIDEFGEDRIRDAPLSESGFTGAGIGAVLHHFRIPAEPRVDVGVVYARRRDADQHFALTRLGHRHVVAVVEFLDAAVTGQKDRAHV